MVHSVIGWVSEVQIEDVIVTDHALLNLNGEKS